MNNHKHAVILVPNHSGGIDRLFEKIPSIWTTENSKFSISMFKTHGRSVFGISVLPFKLVYYSSAIFYMVVLFPIRIVKFFLLCLFGNIDVCHINLSAGGSTIRKIVFAGICRAFRIKYVIHLHSGRYRQFYRDASDPYRKTIRSFFLRASNVIVLGDLWKRFVADDIGVAEDRITVLPNAVSGPVDFSAIKKEVPPKILFLGRLFAPKGIDELVEALADSRLKDLSWTAVLAGDGEVARYRKQIKDLNLQSRVEVTGWVDPDNVVDLLSLSTIFVLPSYSENLPLSMLEAMAFGLCPIVTPVGSIEDVIENGRNGIVIPAKNSDALADALLMLLGQNDVRQSMANNARADFLKSYDISQYQSQLEHTYDKALCTVN